MIEKAWLRYGSWYLEISTYLINRHVLVLKVFLINFLISVPGVADQTLISSKFTPFRGYRRVLLDN
jgi:hypothetical protein